jgi:2-keto-myo-inositol isomerase
MKPCINQVTTLSTSFERDIRAYARGGWTAVELWLTKLETFLESHSIAEARTLLEAKGVQAVGASSQGGLLLSGGAEREVHWEGFRRRLELLADLQVPTLVVAADFVAEPNHDDYARAVAALAEAAELAARYQVRLALEFQKGSRFCASLDTCVALVTQAGAENLGVCLDVFHFYTGPSKYGDLAFLTRENLAWVQVCDLSGVPRELAGDSDRILPGDGDVPLGPILDHLVQIGYDGFLSLEVLNPQFWRIAADQVADVAYQALQRLLGQYQPTGTGSGGP